MCSFIYVRRTSLAIYHFRHRVSLLSLSLEFHLCLQLAPDEHSGPSLMLRSHILREEWEADGVDPWELPLPISCTPFPELGVTPLSVSTCMARFGCVPVLWYRYRCWFSRRLCRRIRSVVQSMLPAHKPI